LNAVLDALLVGLFEEILRVRQADVLAFERDEQGASLSLG
jgi:hypothetical protein